MEVVGRHENPQSAYDYGGIHAMIEYVYSALILFGAPADECRYILSLRGYDEYQIKCFLAVCMAEDVIDSSMMNTFEDYSPYSSDIAQASVLDVVFEMLDCDARSEYYMDLYRGCAQMYSPGRFSVGDSSSAMGLFESCTIDEALLRIMDVLSEQHDSYENLLYVYQGVRVVAGRIIDQESDMSDFYGYILYHAAEKTRIFIRN